MIQKLIADNYITMEQYFLDGIKIEADANKYSFVWKKSTLRFEEKLKVKVQEPACTKAKAKEALEDDEKSAIHARRKVEVESVFGHIKGNRSFRRFSLRGLEKVHTEFGIVALAHNLLKVAASASSLSSKNKRTKKVGRKTLRFSAQLFLL
ncbi:hypothetical protein D3C81_1800120 [compost metagenome]